MMNWNDLRYGAGPRAMGLYLARWAAATAYLGWRGADWTFPIVSLLIFGVALSSIAWWLTRRIDAPAIAVAAPQKESLGLLAYTTLYSVLFIGWGIGAEGRDRPGQAQKWRSWPTN
ncbi:MAG: hypothetical protein IPL18_08850 [Sphingomonadales bacterium]|nr:hypothetical protein [Sphingomonadales bacterium]